MTANDVKKDSITDEEAEELAGKKLVDPYCQGVLGSLNIFVALGAIYPESWDAMLVDMKYYKVEIPFD